MKLRNNYFSISSERASKFVRFGEQFCLLDNCLLSLFIRQQLNDRGVLTSSSHRNSDCFRLVEPVSLTDDFGTWQYDHWRGLFDLELLPYGTNIRFPARWKLADKANIHCRITNNDFSPIESSSSYKEKPRTSSLDVFVHDVCARENNNQGAIWLRVLHQEDITTFPHLANLRQSEWDNIHKLSVNAKKTLKAAVDRIRATMDDERHQYVSYDLDEDDDNKVIHNTTSKRVNFVQIKHNE